MRLTLFELERLIHKHRLVPPGEIYHIELEANAWLETKAGMRRFGFRPAELFVNDGEDIFIIKSHRLTPLVTNAGVDSWVCYEASATFPSHIFLSPTYITSGGLDRVGIYDPSLPLIVTYFSDVILFEVTDGNGRSFWSLRLGHKRYINRASIVHGASMVSGPAGMIQHELSSGGEISTSSATDVVLAEVDLGAAYTTKKFWIQLMAWISSPVTDARFLIYTSTDGVIWNFWHQTTEIAQLTTTPRGFTWNSVNFNVRYIQFRGVSDGVETITARIHPIFAWA